MNTLIVGGAGFIGSQLALHLRALGHRVAIYDNFSRNALQYFDSHDIKIIKGDILDFNVDGEGEFDIVINCAGICGIHNVGDISKNLDVNFIGAKNVIDRLGDKCKRFLHFSTCEVEGLYPDSYKYALFEPRWSYAISKVASEYYCLDKIQDGFPITVIRPTNVFGEGQVGDSAMTNFIRNGMYGQAFTIYNDGKQIRAWCYISDFIDAIDLILKSDESIGKTYTIGNPSNCAQTLRLLEMICTQLGIKQAEIIYKKHFCTDIDYRCPDISEIRKLGFSPKISLEDGIKNTIKWNINVFTGT